MKIPPLDYFGIQFHFTQQKTEKQVVSANLEFNSILVTFQSLKAMVFLSHTPYKLNNT